MDKTTAEHHDTLCGLDEDELFEMAELYEKIIREGGVAFYDDYDEVKQTVMDIKAEVDKNGAAPLFKVFGDSTRIRILYAMFRQEMNVTDLCEALGLSISAISHQLRLLKQAKLVRSRRDGRMVYYMLADEHVKTIIGMAKEHIEE